MLLLLPHTAPQPMSFLIIIIIWSTTLKTEKTHWLTFILYFFCFFYIIQAKTMLLLFYLVKHLIFCVRKRKEKEEINKLKYLNRISLFHRSLKHLSIISWNSKITFIKKKYICINAFFYDFTFSMPILFFFTKFLDWLKLLKNNVLLFLLINLSSTRELFF